eukprot:TRINITY_DN4819_c0_g1::TRINITY_DN4819_c0_g1_i1::g.995::m.995 TRINITY_DN4819_c0_g1::TRINITY_DN4819_c0_g1_i1::g.995  ORF type:complete len:688 (-),score=73.41,sp/A0A0G2JZ79/SIR1_RAT/59.32/5e-100,SIR2/PF02146.12/9.6e+03,SIR2/PF02146.12/1.2e-60,TPP_enzyme_M/PF00205.17/0.38,TPP_enzyme_M/PF00205.17/1.2,Rep_fac_C/PF08542.6/0.11 TRINITY_DN4819_c0_g1_i1:242-2305(-)
MILEQELQDCTANKSQMSSDTFNDDMAALNCKIDAKFDISPCAAHAACHKVDGVSEPCEYEESDVSDSLDAAPEEADDSDDDFDHLSLRRLCLMSVDDLRQIINELKAKGTSATSILKTFHFLLPEDYDSYEDPAASCERFLRPEVIYRLLTELRESIYPRVRCPIVSSIDSALQLISQARKIVVLTGAGISVSCGIPDFRSENGIYSMLKEFNLPDPQAMFDIDFFRKNPVPFFRFAKQIYPGTYYPSQSHRFIRLLQDKSKLLRNYTQNIDTLEQVTGISKVVQCHGSFATASCTRCHRKVQADVIREEIMNMKVPYCRLCSPITDDLNSIRGAGVLKPDIVFFGEKLPREFEDALDADKDSADLLIVMGSSLKVRPVSSVPSLLPRNVPQILINREPVGYPHQFDAELLGDCDTIVQYICHRLGWTLPVPETIASFPSSAAPIQPSTSPEISPEEPTPTPYSYRYLFQGAKVSENPPGHCRDYSEHSDNDSSDGSFWDSEDELPTSSVSPASIRPRTALVNPIPPSSCILPSVVPSLAVVSTTIPTTSVPSASSSPLSPPASSAPEIMTPSRKRKRESDPTDAMDRPRPPTSPIVVHHLPESDLQQYLSGSDSDHSSSSDYSEHAAAIQAQTPTHEPSHDHPTMLTIEPAFPALPLDRTPDHLYSTEDLSANLDLYYYGSDMPN